MAQQKIRRRKKKRTVTVQAWAARRPGKLYKGQVTAIDRDETRLLADIDDLDPAQEGRRYHFECSLPKPGNKASRFLLACGTEADTVGTKICLDDLVGVVLGMRFYPDPHNKDAMRVEFERLPKPQTSDSNSVPNGKQSRQQLDFFKSANDESEWQL